MTPPPAWTPPVGQAGPAPAWGWLEAEFTQLIGPGQASAATLAAVLLALAIGAAHALAPGHGKTIAAAYLVGAHARARDALWLGGVVAAMHTASVLVLGGALYLLAGVPASTTRLGQWMTLASGLLVLGVGLGLVSRQTRLARNRRAVLVHAHPHGGADHDHVLPQGVSPRSPRGLVLLGVSGGLLPSPSAFLVFATAVFAGRAAVGFVLVAAFSVGLATTLALVGVMVLRGRDWLATRTLDSAALARAGRLLPLVSAVFVLAGGAWFTVLALLDLWW